MAINPNAVVEKTMAGFLVKGVLNFDNLPAVCQQGKAMLGLGEVEKKTCVIDFSGMEEQNASALALMLDWYQSARQNDIPVIFTHLSVSLQRMLEAFGLTELLPIN